MFGYNDLVVPDDMKLMADTLVQWSNLKNKTVLVRCDWNACYLYNLFALLFA